MEERWRLEKTPRFIICGLKGAPKHARTPQPLPLGATRTPMKHATVATTALAVPCWLLSSSCSVVVAWTTTPSSRRCFQTSASLQCRQSSARPLARTSSSRSSSDNGYGYGVRGGGSATSCQSFGRLGQRVQGLPWLRQSPSRLCSTAPTGAESDDSGTLVL